MIHASTAATTRAQTLAEKLLSRAAGRTVYAGDLAICAPDAAMGTDGSIPMALDYFRDMQPDGTLPAPARAERLVFALDHYGPVSGERAMALQQRAREYAHAHGICTFEVGEGIGHQLMLERGRVLPGQLAVGADSHAVSYGALNAFGSGIGSSDLAGILQCGQLWLKVPGSIRVVLTGKLPPYASAKDLALTMARRLGAGGANYLALEFAGPGVAALDMDDRIVLANMSVEMGAKAGLFPYDTCTGAWLATRTDAPFDPAEADADAVYVQTLTFDLDAIAPQVALPHRVDNVVDIDAAGHTAIDMVYLGTCTGGRTKDYREALDVLRQGGGVAPGVRLIVTPASAAIQAELEDSGMLAEFYALGAELQPPGCGSCCGTCGSVPADGERVLSTANRNFKGRMGNRQAQIFLASPRACATAAVTGRLTDPREGP
ncbi:3-isopropylmalate dehydratase large subunit [Cupriavidus plantarum]|uniref:3-isopropylmalate dehydratase large subunit n=1 Tax=Cupriavidus plantarum TaxID=942865 RepID=UPI000EAD3108|nr:aconitase/3-isopropylmalate dehydratase large subunit family protein [Cupriavidus plantarum]RLK31686.1 3-isopropylmalate/(R)-2-methylmalate dehydratase large subunit [Cupriavidus plantarum]